MPLHSLLSRLKGRYQRTAAVTFARRPFRMRNSEPLISFTFDDFPRSALSIAGKMLEDLGVFGTYYTSLGLLGQKAPTGDMFTGEELRLVLERGHELGCHTYAHSHASDTPPHTFEESILENQRTLDTLLPRAQFKTLSYPIGCPRPETKRRSARYFRGCRAGGQTYNEGSTDLNLLKAFFIEQSRHEPDAIKAMIDANSRAGGWLIFATHDVCDDPTRYGCRPELFGEIVRYSLQSGARILPVSTALTAIGVKDSSPS
jgi:peptidoglycan/xylan/chitin deacetylase (PgdA/CDA1 family)